MQFHKDTQHMLQTNVTSTHAQRQDGAQGVGQLQKIDSWQADKLPDAVHVLSAAYLATSLEVDAFSYHDPNAEANDKKCQQHMVAGLQSVAHSLQHSS